MSQSPAETTTSGIYTTTVVCSLTEGMDNPQDITNVTLIGAPPGTSPSNLNPGSPGVTFEKTNPTVIIPFGPGITAIVKEISVPNTNTNVIEIHVIITAPNGTVIVDLVSPAGTNKVTQFPVEQLPEGSKVTITFVTNDGKPPANVTISEIACYTPSTAMTIVTTGTTPPAVTGSAATLTISSSTTAGKDPPHLVTLTFQRRL